MLCVGFELQAGQFVEIFRKPGAIIVGSLIQTITAPLMALVIIGLLEPGPDVALAILILSICPGGALSNAYCYLSRMNVAMSVSLTVVSALLSIGTLPLLAIAMLASLEALGIRTVSFPLFETIRTLSLLVLLPVAIGMTARHALKNSPGDYQHVLRVFGFVLLLAVVGMSVLAKSDDILQVLNASWLPAMIFTGATFFSALALSRLLTPGEADVIAVEASVRNIPIALIIGDQLTETSLVGYYLAYLLVQLPVLLLGTALSARASRSLSRQTN